MSDETPIPEQTAKAGRIADLVRVLQSGSVHLPLPAPLSLDIERAMDLFPPLDRPFRTSQVANFRRDALPIPARAGSFHATSGFASTVRPSEAIREDGSWTWRPDPLWGPGRIGAPRHPAADHALRALTARIAEQLSDRMMTQMLQGAWPDSRPPFQRPLDGLERVLRRLEGAPPAPVDQGYALAQFVPPPLAGPFTLDPFPEPPRLTPATLTAIRDSLPKPAEIQVIADEGITLAIHVHSLGENGWILTEEGEASVKVPPAIRMLAGQRKANLAARIRAADDPPAAP